MVQDFYLAGNLHPAWALQDMTSLAISQVTKYPVRRRQAFAHSDAYLCPALAVDWLIRVIALLSLAKTDYLLLDVTNTARGFSWRVSAAYRQAFFTEDQI